jgi:hypothetical protein
MLSENEIKTLAQIVKSEYLPKLRNDINFLDAEKSIIDILEQKYTEIEDIVHKVFKE